MLLARNYLVERVKNEPAWQVAGFKLLLNYCGKKRWIDDRSDSSKS